MTTRRKSVTPPKTVTQQAPIFTSPSNDVLEAEQAAQRALRQAR
jgi:hypothetical protein